MRGEARRSIVTRLSWLDARRMSIVKVFGTWGTKDFGTVCRAAPPSSISRIWPPRSFTRAASTDASLLAEEGEVKTKVATLGEKTDQVVLGIEE